MMKRFLAILLALAMLLSVTAVFAETAAEEAAAEETVLEDVPDTLLATVNGEEIRENNEELQSYLNEILAEDDPSDELFLRVARMYAMIYVLQSTLIEQKTAEANITDEDVKAYEEVLHERWSTIVENITTDVLTQVYGISPSTASEEDLTSAKAYALSYLEANYGYTEDTYVAANATASNVFAQKVMNDLKAADPDLIVTEEEIQQYYDDWARQDMETVGAMAYYQKLVDENSPVLDTIEGEQDIVDAFSSLSPEEQQVYINDVETYEYYNYLYQQMYGYSFTYLPEGYRGILHILLKPEQELLDNWIDLSARLEENQTPAESTDESEEPAEEEEPVTEEMVEAARQAILDSLKEKIDDIMARLEKGEAFEALIAEYGEDPGMQNDEYLKNGYSVHKDGMNYDPDFTKAAAALEKIGDYSDPIVSQFGVHIVYYLRDVPGGTMEVSEAERNQLRDELEQERMNAALSELLDKWVEEADIIYTEEGEAWKWDDDAYDAYYNSYYGDYDDFDDESAE